MTDYSELIPLSTKRPYVQFLVSMLVILITAIIGLVITLLTAWLFFGISPGGAEIGQLNLSVREVNYFKYLQTFQHLSMFLLPALLISFLMKGDFSSYMGLKKSPGLIAAILSMLFPPGAALVK